MRRTLPIAPRARPSAPSWSCPDGHDHGLTSGSHAPGWIDAWCLSVGSVNSPGREGSPRAEPAQEPPGALHPSVNRDPRVIDREESFTPGSELHLCLEYASRSPARVGVLEVSLDSRLGFTLACRRAQNSRPRHRARHRQRRMLENLPQRSREAVPRLARSLLGTRVASVSAGYAHSVAVSEDGRAFSVGQNDRGQVS